MMQFERNLDSNSALQREEDKGVKRYPEGAYKFCTLSTSYLPLKASLLKVSVVMYINKRNCAMKKNSYSAHSPKYFE